MMRSSSTKAVFFAAIALLVFGLLVYFGMRTLRYEVVVREQNLHLIAQERTSKVRELVFKLLREREVRLEVVGGFIDADLGSIRTLIEKDSEIEAIFILEEGKLAYPSDHRTLSQKEVAWRQVIEPVIRDPSLLWTHSDKKEGQAPQSGWLTLKESQGVALVYWYKRGNRILGFRLSYVKFLADVIGVADFDFSPDRLMLIENDRIVYQSLAPERTDRILLDFRVLPYPLSAWRIEYWGYHSESGVIYLWGGISLTLFLFALVFFCWRIYREYTESMRRAREQVNFVAQVSHELKTPLTNILLYTELLKEELGEEENPSWQSSLDVIRSEGGRLTRLIQNILTLTHTPKIHFQTLDLNTFFAHLVEIFSPTFSQKYIRLSYFSGGECTIYTDVDRLTQIVANFLSNAEKYAAAGGEVDFGFTVNLNSVEIYVRDYGLGLPQKELSKIFEPFYRVHSSVTEGVSGTGIGLTITRQLADILGGVINVSNAEPGLRFALTLQINPRPSDEGKIGG